MKTRKSIAVWLICTDGALAGKILLQQRAETEIKDGFTKIQSNPHICQPTFNGWIENNEDPMQAVKREAAEELGSDFAAQFRLHLTEFDIQHFSWRQEEAVCHNLVGLVTEVQLKLVKIHSGAKPNFIAVDSGDLPRIKAIGPGIDPKTQIVLFCDQFHSLQKLFSLRSKLAHLR